MEYGEADRILTLFTREYGKLSAIAKGVRKMKSRKAGHLMPFTEVALYLAKGRNLAVVSQAQAQRVFDDIRQDLKLTAYAAYVMELVDRFTFEEEEHRNLYQLLVDSLDRLNGESDPATVVHYFELRLLEQLGFKPELNVCVNCGKAITAEDQFFSGRLGGALCPRCHSADPNAWRVAVTPLKYLRFLQRSPWSKVRDRVIPEPAEEELSRLMERYFTYLLEHALRTPPFIQAVS